MIDQDGGAVEQGGFGTLSETIMVAGIIAAGNDREITAADLRAAWANRGAGVLK